MNLVVPLPGGYLELSGHLLPCKLGLSTTRTRNVLMLPQRQFFRQGMVTVRKLKQGESLWFCENQLSLSSQGVLG